MESSNRILLIAIVAVSLGVGLLFLQPQIEQKLLPDPLRAHVAIEVGDEGVGIVGPVDLEVGQKYTLHAVLEAETRDGGRVFYSEVSAIQLGDERIEGDDVRPWRRRPVVKVRWFTLEGLQPYIKVPFDGDLDRFEMKPFVRSSWPLAWSIPGEIDAAHDDALQRQEAVDRQRFGTQRYVVQIELYDEETDLLPKGRLRSAGAEELLANPETFPTVRLRLPGRLGPASEAFGQTQIHIEGGEPSAALRTEIDDLSSRDLAFSLFSVIRDQIRGAGKSPEGLDWTPIELAAGASWGEAVEPGDLLRAGDRVVVAFLDLGIEGELDDEDLCFDYAQGATVQHLSDVFTGEGRLEVARLAP